MENNHLKQRLEFATAVCQSVGQAILEFRKHHFLSKSFFKSGEQLKSPVDFAADSWIISMIKTYYPKEEILSEENYEKNKYFKSVKNFWLVDPLDGTASYCNGYDGFCTQMAYIENGKPVIGVVYAPTTNSVYWSVIEKGSYLKNKNKVKKLNLRKKGFPKSYIDNQPAKGSVLKILKEMKINRFLEMGSFGLKICKIAEGKAGIFLKPVEFKIWDIAPGDLILREAGGKLTLWDGDNIDYSGKKIYYKNLVASSCIYHKKIINIIKNEKQKNK